MPFLRVPALFLRRWTPCSTCSLAERGPGELARARPAFGYGKVKKPGPAATGRWSWVIRPGSTGFIAPEGVGVGIIREQSYQEDGQNARIPALYVQLLS